MKGKERQGYERNGMEWKGKGTLVGVNLMESKVAYCAAQA